MRYVRIFFLHFQDVLTERTRSFVWLLLPIINAGLFFVFWHAAFQSNPHVLPNWDTSSILTYYLLLIICGALFISHVEEVIQREIYQGEIVKYLLKPLPFYTFMLFTELPYRLIQGSYAFVAYLLVISFFPMFVPHIPDFSSLVIVGMMFCCSFFLVHTYKLVLGMITFWTKDVRGIRDTSDVVLILFSGFSVPLDLLPGAFQQIIPFLPFSYFVYYPILGLLGKLSFEQLVTTFLIQLLWLVGFVLLYKLMLRNGLKKFTAVGQ